MHMVRSLARNCTWRLRRCKVSDRAAASWLPEKGSEASCSNAYMGQMVQQMQQSYKRSCAIGIDVYAFLLN